MQHSSLLRFLSVILVWIPMANEGRAQDQDSVPTILLQTIVWSRGDLYQQLYSAEQLNLKTNPPLINLADRINLIPGVNSFEGTSGTVKYSFRGFGSRSQFTSSTGQFYLGEIPITGLQGFTTFEDINPAIIGSTEFFSSGGKKYSPILGGTIRLLPIEAATGSEVFNSNSIASFGTLTNNLGFSRNKDGKQTTVNAELGQREGWRDNSDFNRTSVFFSDEGSLHKRLKFILYALSTKSQIPSSLSEADYQNQPEIAASSWGRTQGFEEYDRLITGLTYSSPLFFERGSRQIPKKGSWGITAFYQYRNANEPRPFNILQEQNHHGGLRATFTRTLKDRWGAINAFAEYHLTDDHLQTFENLFDSTSNSYNHPGERLSDLQMQGQRLNGGLGISSEVFPGWELNLDLHWIYQVSSYSQSDMTFGIPFTLNPKAGIAYHGKSGRKSKWYAMIYRSVSLPSLEENLNPDGQLNTSLEPELGWTTEFGYRRHGYGPLELRLNLYYSEVQNLLVPRVVAPDVVVVTNAGSSQHTGVEGLLRLTHDHMFKVNLEKKGVIRRLGLRLDVGGNYGQFTYLSFSDTTGSYDRNKLPGAPEWGVFATGEVTFGSYVYTRRIWDCVLGLQYRALGSYYLDDGNSVQNDPYGIWQIWLGYSRNLGRRWGLKLRSGIQNLSDQLYAPMTVVNNRSFGNSPPRYYYPGDPLNLFLQLNLSYRLAY